MDSTDMALPGKVLSWDCDQSGNEFDQTVQLINVGGCDTGNTTNFPVINLHSSSSSSRYFGNYYYSLDTGMYFNATYLFTVQARLWQPGSGYVYGPRSEGISFTTAEFPESKLYNAINLLFLHISKSLPCVNL